MKTWHLIVPLALAWTTTLAHGAEVQVAVAGNFTGPMEKIAPAFEQATGHKVIVSYGTVGKFYSQITNGAPFEALLSSDRQEPSIGTYRT